MKWLLPLLWPSLLPAEIVETTLTLVPASSSENTLALGLTVTGISSSDASIASGTIDIRIDIDPESGEISSLELLSGDVSATPVQLVGRFLFATIYDVSTSTLGATLSTPLPPAPVIDGRSAASFHEVTINEGTLSGSALGEPIPEQNFTETPVSGTGMDGSFLEISATLNPASTSTGRLFDLDFSFPVDISQPIEADGISATVSAIGNMRATGQAKFTVQPPNLYRVWATDNRRAEASFSANDFSSLLPNGLLWALGYESGDTPSLLSPTGDGSGTFTLELPAVGTAAEVAVQKNLDPSDPDGWITIDTIPAGTTTARGPFGGDSERAFLRLLAEDPNE